MGVAFSHGDAQWSYSGFNSLRCKIGRMHGLKIVTVSPDYNIKYPDYKHLDENDPLRQFLDLSDCDAVITPKLAEVLYPYLKGCARQLEDDFFGWHDRRNLFYLAQGMELAAFLNEDFTFH